MERNYVLRPAGAVLLLFASLIEPRLAAQIPDFTPSTPLLRALLYGDSEAAMRLLNAGADPNEARFLVFSPLVLAIIHKDAALVRAMIAKGADVKALDATGATTLMWAAFHEVDDTELVEMLLRAGVDPKARDRAGNTALSWATQRGHQRIIGMLKVAGASDQAPTKVAVEKTVALLQKSSAQFLKVSSCTSCHHQSLPQMALGAARDKHLSVNEDLAREESKATVRTLESIRKMTEANRAVPDPAVSVSYALIGLAAEHYPSDALTTAMAQVIANEQLPDGSFRTIPLRPPIEASKFSATALSLRALQLYGGAVPAGGWRLANATRWLRDSAPRTTEDRVMRLLGLAWGKAESKDIADAARQVIREQRPSGGWSQLSGLEADAYATGQALVALYQSGQMAASNPVYQRGVAFLLRTQLADGSWMVHTRSFPVQAPKDSGFPHGKHQWISAAGSSWAAMALAYSMEAPAAAAVSMSR